MKSIRSKSLKKGCCSLLKLSQSHGFSMGKTIGKVTRLVGNDVRLLIHAGVCIFFAYVLRKVWWRFRSEFVDSTIKQFLIFLIFRIYHFTYFPKFSFKLMNLYDMNFGYLAHYFALPCWPSPLLFETTVFS